LAVDAANLPRLPPLSRYVYALGFEFWGERLRSTGRASSLFVLRRVGAEGRAMKLPDSYRVAY
jgi:hypothetical protein